MSPGPGAILLVEDNPDDVELTMLALELPPLRRRIPRRRGSA